MQLLCAPESDLFEWFIMCIIGYKAQRVVCGGANDANECWLVGHINLPGNYFHSTIQVNLQQKNAGEFKP